MPLPSLTQVFEKILACIIIKKGDQKIDRLLAKLRTIDLNYSSLEAINILYSSIEPTTNFSYSRKPVPAGIR